MGLIHYIQNVGRRIRRNAFREESRRLLVEKTLKLNVLEERVADAEASGMGVYDPTDLLNTTREDVKQLYRQITSPEKYV